MVAAGVAVQHTAGAKSNGAIEIDTGRGRMILAAGFFLAQTHMREDAASQAYATELINNFSLGSNMSSEKSVVIVPHASETSLPNLR